MRFKIVIREMTWHSRALMDPNWSRTSTPRKVVLQGPGGRAWEWRVVFATRVAENNAGCAWYCVAMSAFAFRTAEADDEKKRYLRAMRCDVGETHMERRGASDGRGFEEGMKGRGEGKDGTTRRCIASASAMNEATGLGRNFHHPLAAFVSSKNYCNVASSCEVPL
jgi:hypothetical protein